MRPRRQSHNQSSSFQHSDVTANRCGKRGCGSNGRETAEREKERRLVFRATGVDIKRVEMSRRNQERPCAIGSFPNSFHGPEVGIVFALSIGFPSVVRANGTTNADCRCRDADSRGVGYAPRSTYTSNETARERNGGTEKAGEAAASYETDRDGQRNERDFLSRASPFLLRSLFHSRWTISVFARERGSFSLSESLSVCT